jgi:hypothetical protein
MLLHSNPLFAIYFGSAEDDLEPDQYLHYPPGTSLLSIEPYKKLKKMMQLERLTFLHQTHSNKGIVVAKDIIEPFKVDGDFLVTQEKKYGIGVMTADCLPIVFYDNFHHVAAIVHAGWKSSVMRIAPKMVQKMQELYGTKVEHLRVFFGPSAKKCCYRIDEEFLVHLKPFSFADQVVYKDDDGLRFDLPLFNRLQLEAVGLPKEAFKMDYNFCTICDTRYCSYRRDGKNACRQMTVVVLK